MAIKDFKFSIGQKVLTVNILLILIFTGNTVFSLFSLRKEAEAIHYSFEIIDPSVDALEDFTLMVNRSRMYIINWIYLPENEDDRNQLRRLKDFDFPTLKDKITALSIKWENQQLVSKVDSIIFKFDEILTVNREIMQDLSGIDYDPFDRDEAIKKLKTVIIPISNDLVSELDDIVKSEKKERALAEKKILQSIASFRNNSLLIGAILFIFGVVLTFLSYKNITEPIRYMNQVAWELSRGRIPDVAQKFTKRAQDEIGEMAIAISRLVKGLNATSLFAQAVGKGDYEEDFEPLSEEDILGNELIKMRNNLLRVSKDSEERSWAMTGISKFSDMLRDNHDDLSKMYDNLLKELIHYVDANQGGVFLISEEKTEEKDYMIAESCYAWNRFKGLGRKVYRGEGLAGQSWLEESTIYATDFPDEYIEITSGLGKKNPTSILIVPVKFNDMMFGVIELASLQDFKPYQIDFIEHVAESFASTLSSVKVNLRTKKLLDESTQLTEQLRMQEEETRMNMEELQATQEEMRRKQEELTEIKNNLEHEVQRQTFILREQGEELRKQNIQLLAQQEQMQMTQQNLMNSERKLRSILNGAVDGVITTNEKGMIEMVNEATLTLTGYKSHRIKGAYIDRIFPSIIPEKLKLYGLLKSKLYRRDGVREEVELVYSQVKYEGQTHILFFIRNANLHRANPEEAL